MRGCINLPELQWGREVERVTGHFLLLHARAPLCGYAHKCEHVRLRQLKQDASGQ